MQEPFQTQEESAKEQNIESSQEQNTESLQEREPFRKSGAGSEPEQSTEPLQKQKKKSAPKQEKTISARKICFIALFTAINVAFSSFGIPVPGGHLYLNDVIICFAALLFDPISAFVVGGVGAFLGDMLFYPAPMFVSLVTHGLQAVAISLIVGNKAKPAKLGKVIFAVATGAVIMVTGYSLGRAFVYSTPEYALLKLPFQFLQAGVGAVVAVLLYRSPLRRLITVPKD